MLAVPSPAPQGGQRSMAQPAGGAAVPPPTAAWCQQPDVPSCLPFDYSWATAAAALEGEEAAASGAYFLASPTGPAMDSIPADWGLSACWPEAGGVGLSGCNTWPPPESAFGDQPGIPLQCIPQQPFMQPFGLPQGQSACLPDQAAYALAAAAHHWQQQQLYPYQHLSQLQVLPEGAPLHPYQHPYHFQLPPPALTAAAAATTTNLPALVPAFVISPPQPPTSKAKLARKKKAALTREASYGCESTSLAASHSSVMVPSAEPSIVEDATGGDAGAAAGSSAAGAGSEGAPGVEPATGGSSCKSPHMQLHTCQLDAVDSSCGTLAGAKPTQHQPGPPSIAYDRAPRAVEWRPYSFADYRQRNYDSKQQAKYWQLGGLGPRLASDTEWQLQQSRRERQQQFGQAVSAHNRQRLSQHPPRPILPPRPAGADVRERALQFSQTQVPKPSSFKARGQATGAPAAGVEAAAAAAVAAQDAGGAPAATTGIGIGEGVAFTGEAGQVEALRTSSCGPIHQPVPEPATGC